MGFQELVGQYFFSEKQQERFHKLHTTMRKCGVAFVVVSAATVAGLIQVLAWPTKALLACIPGQCV